MFHGVLRRVRIQIILLLSFFALNLSLMAILGLVSYRAVAEEITTGAGQASLAALQEASKRLALRLSMVEETATTLSLSPALERLLQEPGDSWEQVRANTAAKDLMKPYNRLPEITGLHVLVPGWQMAPYQTSGIGLAAVEAVRDQAWYRPIEQFDSGWLGLHTNNLYPNSPAREVLTHVRKLYDTGSGDLLGVIAIDVSLESLRPMLGSRQGSLFITGPAGEFVHQVSGPAPPGYLYRPILDQLAARHASYTSIRLETQPSLLLSTEPVLGSLRLVQIVPVDELTKGLHKIRLAFLWGGAACALLSLVLAWALSRAFSGPIDRLVRAMKLVGEGRLDVRVPVKHKNEFGDMEAGFNGMVARLEQQVADLKEVHRRQRRAELEALQAQINPHFLYNTLDMINWMAIGEKQPKISEVVTLLGRFFRLGLAKGETLVPLRQELEHLHTYIQLQQIRFRGVFRVEEHIAPDLLDYRVPKIVLQPFVENCLRHAFASTGGHGTIRLEGVSLEDRLMLTVADDGSGIIGEVVPDPQRIGTGYGIRNVHERIQVLFGPDYGVAVETEPGKGTSVHITLPLMAKEESHTDVVRDVG